MDYNELTKICEAKRILIKEVAEHIGMTPNGMKNALEQGTFKMSLIVPMCEKLNITLDEFFMYEKSGRCINCSQIGGTNNTMNNSISEEIIRTFREQLQEKDKQIAELLKHLK